jgi:hypothetical protein
VEEVEEVKEVVEKRLEDGDERGCGRREEEHNILNAQIKNTMKIVEKDRAEVVP